MNSGLNKQWLLPLVAVLVLIKFVLMPVVLWQDEVMADIARHEQRNAKAGRLVDNQAQLKAQLSALGENYQAQVEAFPRYATAAGFRIETKIKLDNLLKQKNLAVARFTWRDEVDSEVFPGMFKARFNVSFSGKLKDFALLHAALDSSEKAFRISNFGSNIKAQSKTSLGTVRGSLTVEAYYWLGTGPETGLPKAGQ